MTTNSIKDLKESLYSLLRTVKTRADTMEISVDNSKKLKIELPYNIVILLLEIYQRLHIPKLQPTTKKLVYLYSSLLHSQWLLNRTLIS